MLLRRDAGVADGVGVGVCARNSPTATTVNTKANQKLIHTPPKALPMYGRGSKMVLFGKYKNPVICKISKSYGVLPEKQLTFAVAPLFLSTGNEVRRIDALRSRAN